MAFLTERRDGMNRKMLRAAAFAVVSVVAFACSSSPIAGRPIPGIGIPEPPAEFSLAVEPGAVDGSDSHGWESASSSGGQANEIADWYRETLRAQGWTYEADGMSINLIGSEGIENGNGIAMDEVWSKEGRYVGVIVVLNNDRLDLTIRACPVLEDCT